MTEAAAHVYRPTARPRPAGAPNRTTDLRLITDSDPETCNAEPGTPAVERETYLRRWSELKSAITDSDRWVKVGTATIAYFTPPAVFTDRPASLAELAAYARTAPWTAQQHVAKPYTDEATGKQVKTGLIRAAGIWYYRGVGYPYTVWSRYKEWIIQRPGRAVPILLVVKLLASTSYGQWTVEHLITPAVHAVMWVLL